MNRYGARSLHHGSDKVLIYFTSKVRWDIYANLLGKTENWKKKKKDYSLLHSLLCVSCSHHLYFNCTFYSASLNIFSG